MTQNDVVYIDGELFTSAEAEELLKAGLIESCPYDECEQDYHAFEGVILQRRAS